MRLYKERVFIWVGSDFPAAKKSKGAVCCRVGSYRALLCLDSYILHLFSPSFNLSKKWGKMSIREVGIHLCDAVERAMCVCVWVGENEGCLKKFKDCSPMIGEHFVLFQTNRRFCLRGGGCSYR